MAQVGVELTRADAKVLVQEAIAAASGGGNQPTAPLTIDVGTLKIDPIEKTYERMLSPARDLLIYTLSHALSHRHYHHLVRSEQKSLAISLAPLNLVEDASIFGTLLKLLDLRGHSKEPKFHIE